MSPEYLRIVCQRAPDLLHLANSLIFVPCACGLKVKVPLMFAGATIRCPRCGAEDQVPAAPAASWQTAHN